MTASSDPATRERSRVALVTGEAFPDLWVDDHPLRDALRARGVAVDTVRWDDEAADWSAYDLVRCGIASYGLSPAPDVVNSGELGLVPAMTARASVRRVSAMACASSRRRLMTRLTESSPTVTPYSASAASIVPRLWVMTMNWVP